MLDLSAEMAQLWASLGPAPSGRARTIQFVAAHRGAGASTFAREFARYAATQAHKPVWLIDVDLNGPGQTEAIRSQPQRYGRLGQAAAASPDG
ncbi:MAG: hfsB, partial [Caulobacteraceae bacterium]